MSYKKEYSDMLTSAIRYLTDNTDITYFTDGSIAKALVETNILEIDRLQNYFTEVSKNSFISRASGFYLDLWGEVLGIPRIVDKKAFAFATDGSVRFYVDNGTLGTKLPHPTNPALGLVPEGTLIQNATKTLAFVVAEAATFPKNARYVNVSVVAADSGTSFNVGANQLVIHNLSATDVKVTNPISISTGSDVESDSDYRFRLSRALSSRFGSNPISIELASLTSPSVASSKILQYQRGAGTFDVLLIPRGNKVTRAAIEQTRSAIESVAAYGISFKIREPEYVPIRLSIQLTYNRGTSSGEQLSARNLVQEAILDYIASIPIGGELVINQLRSSAISASNIIKDIKILELYIDCKPKTLRNIQLREDELFIPDESVVDPIEVV